MGVKIKPKETPKKGEAERTKHSVPMPSYGLQNPGKDSFSPSTENKTPTGTRYDYQKDQSIAPTQYDLGPSAVYKKNKSLGPMAKLHGGPDNKATGNAKNNTSTSNISKVASNMKMKDYLLTGITVDAEVDVQTRKKDKFKPTTVKPDSENPGIVREQSPKNAVLNYTKGGGLERDAKLDDRKRMSVFPNVGSKASLDQRFRNELKKRSANLGVPDPVDDVLFNDNPDVKLYNSGPQAMMDKKKADRKEKREINRNTRKTEGTRLGQFIRKKINKIKN